MHMETLENNALLVGMLCRVKIGEINDDTMKLYWNNTKMLNYSSALKSKNNKYCIKMGHAIETPFWFFNSTLKGVELVFNQHLLGFQEKGKVSGLKLGLHSKAKKEK